MSKYMDYDRISKREEKIARYDAALGIDGPRKPTHLTVPIREWDISVRLYNNLNKHEIKSLDDLRLYERSEVFSFRNFGRQSQVELNNLMEEYGGWFYDEFENHALVQSRLKAGYDWVKNSEHLREAYGLKELPTAEYLDPVHTKIHEWCQNKQELLLQSVDVLHPPMADKLHKAGLHVLGEIVIEENPHSLAAKGFDGSDIDSLTYGVRLLDEDLVMFMRHKAMIQSNAAFASLSPQEQEQETQRVRLMRNFRAP